MSLEPENTQPPVLSPNALIAIRDIIKVSIERGTFKAEEVASVGSVFNELNGFVNYLVAVIQSKEEATQTEEEPKA